MKRFLPPAVGLFLLVLFPFLGNAQPVGVTDEVPLSPPELAEAPSVQNQPAIAANGSTFLALWSDFRYGVSDVMGARIDPNGFVIDPAGLPIAPTYLGDYAPRLVWNGHSYAVIFTTQRAGPMLVEVAPDGRVLGGGHLLEGDNYAGSAGIAWNGSLHLAVWSHGPGARGRFFSSTMERTGEDLDLGSDGHYVTVGSNGVDFLVVTVAETGETTVRTVSASGTVSAPASLGKSTYDIEVASNGSGYVIALPTENGVELLALDTGGRVVRRLVLAGAADPALVWDGTRWLVAWTASERIHVAVVDAALNLVRGTRLLTSETRQSNPAIAVMGSRVLMTWSDAVDTIWSDIRGAMVARTSFAEAPLVSSSLVSGGLPHQVPLDAVWRGETLNVLWREGDPGYPHLVLRTAAGYAQLGAASDGRLAWNGSTFALLLLRDQRVYVQRLNANGTPFGAPVQLSTEQVQVIDIASDGQDFYAVWGTGGDLFGVKIFADGSVGTPRRFSPAGDEFGYAPIDLISTPSGYALLSIRTFGIRFGSRIGAYDVRYELAMLDSAGATTRTAIVADYPSTWPEGADLAASGNDLMVTWRNGGTYAQRYSLELARLGPELAGVSMGEPLVAWNGSSYIFPAWALTNSGGGRGRLELRRSLVEEGNVLGDVSFPIFATSATGRTALVYGRSLPQIPEAHDGGVTRAFVRYLVSWRTRAVASGGQ